MADSSLFATTSSTLPPRPLKRRTPSQDLDFFTPAATSFNPRPYSPRSIPSTSLNSAPLRHYPRPLDPLSIPPVGMDPQVSDPNVVFIHPPFTTFPRSVLYPDGLSYQLMAENPEWFLDADDFVSQQNLNPSAISYPPHLEPPRGWCPAKKKDLKDRGHEGWPEGEEPRLRCTFCRRTYAGVNAKSMWRRHVFEKHKIAMSNRRDSNERPRGRGSNKENRQTASKPHQESHDSLVSIDIHPQTEFRNTSFKSKFRSHASVAEDAGQQRIPLGKDSDNVPDPSTLGVFQGEFPIPQDDAKPRHHPLSRSYIPPPSPPLTPQSSIPSDAVNTSLEKNSQLSTPPSPTLPVVPPSPYDPLLTPSFRHSPPRLPSDQPWRFPSPSHPLHSRSRELSLSMLIRDLSSPAAKGSLTMGGSPSLVASPVASPSVFGSSVGKRSILDLDTPESLEKLSRSPRASLSRGKLSIPNEKIRYLIQESPLQRTTRTTIKRRRQLDPAFSDEWLSDVSFAPSTSNMDNLGNSDPFSMGYSPWRTNENPRGRPSFPMAITGAESPVLRNTARPTSIGFGIGLLQPFTLPEGNSHHLVDGSDLDDELLTCATLTEEEDDEAEVACFLAMSSKDNREGDTQETPLSKKRKITCEPD